MASQPGGRLACAPETASPEKPALISPLAIISTLRCVDDVGRQLQLTDVLLVVDHPGDLGAVETVLVDQGCRASETSFVVTE